MKLTLLALFFVFLSQIADAQNRKIDSISNLITKAKTDTGRINLLNVKATAYSENNLDSAIHIALENINQSKQIHYLKGEADANRIVGSNLTLKGNFAAAKLNFTTAENLYNQTKDSAGIDKLNRSYGIYYGSQSKYDSAIFFFKKNAAYLEKTGNTKDLSSAYQNIAVSYTMMNDFQQTLTYQSKALQLAEKINDVSNMAYINLNMGIGYSNITDYKKSEELFRKAIDYAKQAGIKNVELYGYANLASTLNITKRYQESYIYAIKAATLGKVLGDSAIVASCLGRAGVALAAMKRYDEAEELIDSAIVIADLAGTPLNIFQTQTNMGFLKKEQGKYKEAINYYEKGMAVLKASDMYDEQTGNTYGELAECYEKAGFYEKALASFKLSTRILDSVRSNENVRKATEQSLNYDFSKKEEIQKAEKDKQDRDNEIKLIFLIAFLLVFITLTTVALFAYKREQKAKVLLNSQKKELETTLAELKTAQAQLIQSEKMASLGELTAGIAHEIQNPLNFVNNFSEVNKEMLEELLSEKLKVRSERDEELEIELLNDIKSNEEKINHHGKRADAIVKGMLQHSRKNNGAKEPTNINALCDEYLRLSYHGLRAKDKSFNADFKTNFDESIGKINIVPQDIGRVLLNLFNNAFYAVNEKKKLSVVSYQPMVSVTTKKINDKVEISVTDNGNGIPQQILDKIFQPFFTTKPTGEGTGLGLSMSYDIITKEHGGTITAESEQNSYSLFIITLPI